MKKLLSLLLAGVLCFSIVACGGDDASKDASNEGTPSASDDASTTDDATSNASAEDATK